MNKPTILLGAAAIVLIGATGWVVSQESSPQSITAPNEPDIQVGQALYGEYCASCHGKKKT